MKMKRMPMLWLLVLMMLGSAQAGECGGRPESLQPVGWRAAEETALDVPYVPTPEKVVAKMLAMAEVGADDLLYDLGSGDGRIVIMAARERGARGVGFDLNPERIAKSRENAAAADVTGLVSFRHQDLFEVDLSEATVLTLYLLPSVNLRLRPKILRELQPGTRVVSHAFDMEAWRPDETATVEGNSIYFWVVPANVAGTWEWREANGAGGDRVLHLVQEFQEVSGTLIAGEEELPLRDVVLQGERLEFTVEEDAGGSRAPVRYEGVVNGDAITGRVAPAGASGEEAAWAARRDPATALPLDGAEAVGL
jgi:SAM-dependent methyltransferase